MDVLFKSKYNDDARALGPLFSPLSPHMWALRSIPSTTRLATVASTATTSSPRARRAVVMSATPSSRKPGVATDEEFDAFLARNAHRKVYVCDARNPDFSVEPDDEKFGGDGKSAPIADCGTSKRPRAVNVPYKRDENRLDPNALKTLEDAVGGDKTTPIVTHCGGGGRGQKAKEYLESLGYVDVINGGGPAVAELWAKFGSA